MTMSYVRMHVSLDNAIPTNFIIKISVVWNAPHP